MLTAESTYSNRTMERIKIRLFCAYYHFRDQWKFLILHSVGLLNTISFLRTIGLQSQGSYMAEVNFGLGFFLFLLLRSPYSSNKHRGNPFQKQFLLFFLLCLLFKVMGWGGLISSSNCNATRTYHFLIKLSCLELKQHYIF